MSHRVKRHPFGGLKRFVVPTGLSPLDNALCGGITQGTLVHLYGTPGSGKTTLAMQIAAMAMRGGWRVAWIDCNGSFSIVRFQEILGQQALFDRLLLARPTCFADQTTLIQQLKCVVDRVAVLVVDPITHFYRAERYAEGSQSFFQELVDQQLSTLLGLAHLHRLVVLTLNYATSDHRGQASPLAAAGFQRIEQYRLYLHEVSNLLEPADWKAMHLEVSPHGQGTRFHFRITRNGIADLRPVEEVDPRESD